MEEGPKEAMCPSELESREGCAKIAVISYKSRTEDRDEENDIKKPTQSQHHRQLEPACI